MVEDAVFCLLFWFCRTFLLFCFSFTRCCSEFGLACAIAIVCRCYFGSCSLLLYRLQKVLTCTYKLYCTRYSLSLFLILWVENKINPRQVLIDLYLKNFKGVTTTVIKYEVGKKLKDDIGSARSAPLLPTGTVAAVASAVHSYSTEVPMVPMVLGTYY